MQGYAYTCWNKFYTADANSPGNQKSLFVVPTLKRLRPSRPRLEASTSVLGLLGMRSSSSLNPEAFRMLIICLVDGHKSHPDQKPLSVSDRMSDSSSRLARI